MESGKRGALTSIVASWRNRQDKSMVVLSNVVVGRKPATPATA
jgi:hypothetical protein